MDYQTLLTGKSARLALGAIIALVGFVMMYPDVLGIPLESATILPGVPFDVFGGAVFALGIFLVAKGGKAE